MRWMKLEPIIQSEVSQKEKHQYSMKVTVKLLSRVRLSATPWTVAHQAALSLGVSIHMCYYTVLVYFFLAYFTRYNRLQLHPSH